MQNYTWALIDEPYNERSQLRTVDTQLWTTYILQAFFLQGKKKKHHLGTRFESRALYIPLGQNFAFELAEVCGSV